MNRLNIKSILIYMDDRISNYIGDCIVRLSNMKFLQHNFPNAKVYVNTPSKIFSIIAKHSPTVQGVTHLPMDMVDYNNYDIILVCFDKKRSLLECIDNYVERQKYKKFSVFDVSKGNNLNENINQIQPLPEFDDVPLPESLLIDINRREISLTDEELNDGKRFLDQYISSERLIVFFLSASNYIRTLRMSVTIELIKYFQSIPGKKLVIFDPGNDKDVFLTSMGVNVENILIVKQKPLREIFAIMADSRIELIMGPCTGLMHAGSGIYNTLMKRNSSIRVPLMIVYTGLYYEMSNAIQWWKGSLVKCLVILLDQNNLKRVCLLEDVDQQRFHFQDGILPVSEYTFEMLKEVVKRELAL